MQKEGYLSDYSDQASDLSRYSFFDYMRGPTVTLRTANKESGLMRTYKGGRIHGWFATNIASCERFMASIRRGPGQGGSGDDVTLDSLLLKDEGVLLKGKAAAKWMELASVLGSDRIVHDLLGTITVTQLLKQRLKGSGARLDDHEEESIVDELLEILGISDVKESIVGDRFRKFLSTGQRRRVVLATLLLLRPRLIFIPHVFQGLDQATAGRVLNLLRSLAQDCGCTIFLLTEEVSPIYLNVDSITVSCGKNIVLHGDREEVIRMVTCTGNQQSEPDLSAPKRFLIEIENLFENFEIGLHQRHFQNSRVQQNIKTSSDNEADIKLAEGEFRCVSDEKDLTIDLFNINGNRNWFFFHRISDGWCRRISRRIKYAAFETSASKVLPFRSYITFCLLYLTVGIVLGFVFFQIPQRITQNPSYGDISSWLSALSSGGFARFILDGVNAWFYGLGGDSENLGPRPLAYLAAHGVDSDGTKPIQQLFSSATTWRYLRCFVRCYWNTFPMMSPEWDYPNPNMMSQGDEYDLLIKPELPVCLDLLYENISDISLSEVLNPDDTISDAMALLQSVHFLLYQVDFEKHFPDLTDAWNSEGEGLDGYWLPVIGSGYGAVNNAVVCLGLPDIPKRRDWPDWPAEYSPGAKPQDNSIAKSRLPDVNQLLSLFAGVDEPPQINFSGSYGNWLMKVVPLNWPGDQLLAALYSISTFDPVQDHNVAWRELIDELRRIKDIATRECQTELCSNMWKVLMKLEAYFWDICYMLWQGLNTAGLLFAVNAAVPFFTVEGLLGFSAQRTRYKTERGHAMYGPVTYGVVAALVDSTFSIMPIVLSIFFWLLIAGVTDWSGMYLFVTYALALASFNFCFFMGSVWRHNEVALVVSSFIFIAMLLFSGFIVRLPPDDVSWKSVLTAVSIHRWGYQGYLLWFSPPSCAAGPEVYGVLTNDAFLSLSGVANDCSQSVVGSISVLLCMAIIFRIGGQTVLELT